MIHTTLPIGAGRVLLTATAGLVLGTAYFAALRRTVLLLVSTHNWQGAAVLTLGRIAVAVAALFFAAKLGAASLLAAFVGFLAAREVIVRAQRKAG